MTLLDQILLRERQRAQAGRMRVISENIANADTTATKKGDAPYRRKVVTFQKTLDNELGVQTVQLGRSVAAADPEELPEDLVAAILKARTQP